MTPPPTESWWVNLDRDRFYDRVRAEAARLANSDQTRMPQKAEPKQTGAGRPKGKP